MVQYYGILYAYHIFTWVHLWYCNGLLPHVYISIHNMSSPVAQCVARRGAYAAMRMVAGSRPDLAIA